MNERRGVLTAGSWIIDLNKTIARAPIGWVEQTKDCAAFKFQAPLRRRLGAFHSHGSSSAARIALIASPIRSP